MKALSLFLIFYINLVSNTNKIDSHNLTIINMSNNPLHLSFEDKYGNINGIWIEKNKTKNLLLDSPKKRIVFEKNSNLFPCIAKSGDTLMVQLKNNMYTILNSENASIYSFLSEKYAILKTPFSSIVYTRKTNYTEILKEINKYRINRLDYLDKLNRSSNEFLDELKLIVEFKYINELLSPLNSNNFTELIIPDFYRQVIDNAIFKISKTPIRDSDIDLVKQYYWGILKYKILTKNLSTSQAKIDFINSNFSSSYLRNYLIWRLYDKEKLRAEERNIYSKYFRFCGDPDYLNKIENQKKGWGNF